jgi:hypothetical protein
MALEEFPASEPRFSIKVFTAVNKYFVTFYFETTCSLVDDFLRCEGR